jgi:hypothetical protein
VPFRLAAGGAHREGHAEQSESKETDGEPNHNHDTDHPVETVLAGIHRIFGGGAVIVVNFCRFCGQEGSLGTGR